VTADTRESMRFRGEIKRGFGRASFFLSLEYYKKAIREKVGFEPYPGTINVKVSPGVKEKVLKSSKLIKGTGKLGPIRIALGHSMGRRCAVIIPERSEHGEEIIEVIFPEEVKGIGSEIEVEVIPWEEIGSGT